jgi:methyl-accepting chemotaxis protein
MEEINKSSKKIGDIITVIDEIAFQTNLLALNAAVEAARAGEHGRGFAVVAAEVRNLAQRSATAAKEIKGLIGESMQKVSEGSELVNQCGKTLEEIVGSVKHVADIVSEISAASQEQSNGIDQVSKTLVAMNKSTQENAALVEEAASASEVMGEEARELTKKVAFFRLPDEALSALTAGEAPQVKDHPKGQGSGPCPGNRMVMRAKAEPVQPAPKAQQSKPKNRAAGPDAGEQWEEF